MASNLKVEKDKLMLSSGATVSMLNNRKYLSFLSSCPKYIELADGPEIPSTGSGTIHIELQVITPELRNFLLAPMFSLKLTILRPHGRQILAFNKKSSNILKNKNNNILE
ncbi:hypothetical protein O181_059716 [Austropuccinia psidii MF-1]|uniref:Uncharacterized protein n=1 Tax=Austropuccinia psidii MF-1 TaxID=1389203 RepID=A0A9Q3HVX7_9BASI|nr:hypothetical protein [Austropuccinia psidii MF-1]